MSAVSVNDKKELTKDHVKKIFKISDSKASEWHPFLKSTCDEFGITLKYQIAAFLANVAIESGNLSTFVENLNYSSSRLLQIFPKYFKTKEDADAYAGKPEKIANRVYGNRMGNGDESSGDGFKYRGRGLIQLTGKSNYQACNRSGIPAMDNPDYLATKEGAARSAGWYWKSRGCNTPADQSDITKVRMLVNGGQNGLSEVKGVWQLAINVLSDEEENKPIDDSGTGETKNSTVNSKPNPEESPTPDAPTSTMTEPVVAGKAIYPWNQPFQSRSGHVIEIDDTPGRERLHWYHRTGTYCEMLPDGKHVIKSVHERWDICALDRFHITGQNYTHKIGQDYYTKVGGKAVLSVGSSYTIEAPDRMQVNTPEACFSNTVRAKLVDAKLLRQSGGIADLRARDSVHADRSYGLGGEPGPAGGVSARPNDLYDGDDFTFIPKVVNEGFLGWISKKFDDALNLLSKGLNIIIDGDSNTTVNGDTLHETGGNKIDLVDGDSLEHINGNKSMIVSGDVTLNKLPLASALLGQKLSGDNLISGKDNLPSEEGLNDGVCVLYVDVSTFTPTIMIAMIESGKWKHFELSKTTLKE